MRQNADPSLAPQFLLKLAQSLNEYKLRQMAHMLPPWGLCNMSSPSQVSLEGLLSPVTPAACAVKHVPLWQDSSWGRLPLRAEHYSAPSLMLAREESHKSSKASSTASSPVTPALESSLLKVEAKMPPALARAPG